MQELTVAAVVALILATTIKSFFDWVVKKNLQNSNERLSKLEKQVLETQDRTKANHSLLVELHSWHNVKDADGVPIWYVRKSLEEIVKQNAEAVSLLSQQSIIQTQVLKELAEGQKEIFSEIRRFWIEHQDR